MKARFFLVAAPVALASPLWATVYMTVPQLQAQLFPNTALKPDFRALTADQAKAIRAKAGVSPLSKDVKLWRAPDGSALIVDEVVGKHEFITFAVALDPSAAIKDVEILEYRESYGGQVRDPAWRGQFVGKRDGAPLVLDRDIRNNSGGTLSARHVTDGVKRLLATYAIAYGNGHV